jgi:multidrug resistance efflux pump
VLHSLEKDVAHLQEQAKTAGEKAQGALPDEAAARAYLETKQEALERVQTLQERIAGLRQSLERSQTLRDELATREAELKALESGEHLAELEADIRGDLLEHK